ncbi:unnamed protein product [Aphanomyces euteiches]
MHACFPSSLLFLARPGTSCLVWIVRGMHFQHYAAVCGRATCAAKESLFSHQLSSTWSPHSVHTIQIAAPRRQILSSSQSYPKSQCSRGIAFPWLNAADAAVRNRRSAWHPVKVTFSDKHMLSHMWT